MKKTIVAIILLIIASTVVFTEPARASGDYWITRAPIPVAFGVEEAATVNGQIYVFGQDANGNPLTYAYDPTANNWTERAPMPTSRTSFGLVACGNEIYAIGGVTGFTADGLALSTGANEMYNPATNTWTNKAPMPTSRSEIEVVTANGKIYIMGGRTAGAYSTVNTTEIYDPATATWTSGTGMLYPVVLAASAVIGNNIYVIGGQDEFNHPNSDLPNSNINLATNQIYNLSTDSWTIGQPIPEGGWQAVGSATIGEYAPERAYVIGGLSNSGAPLSNNQIYDPDTDSWTSGAAFPTTHDYVTNTLAAVNLNDSLYVIGGIARANEGFYEITEQYVPGGYNGTVLPEQPIVNPTSTPSNSASVSPSPSIAEFQWWVIPAFLLITLILVSLATKSMQGMRRRQ